MLRIPNTVIFRVQFRIGVESMEPTASVMAIKNLAVTAAMQPFDWDAGRRYFGAL